MFVCEWYSLVGPDDDITEAYERALEVSVAVANALSHVNRFDLDEPEEIKGSVKHFDDECYMEQIKASLQKEAEAAFAESKRSQVILIVCSASRLRTRLLFDAYQKCPALFPLLTKNARSK